ncbi:MAG: CsiV family protein, partial [Anaerolineales bacterium]
QALQKLDGDDSYQILFHKRWVEEAKPEDDADLIRINNDDGSLDGTMKFYLSRFLHIDVNLLLKQVPPVADLQSDLAPPTMYYRISEERRVGPDEMQYFDHPKFGAIISIKPVLTDTK